MDHQVTTRFLSRSIIILCLACGNVSANIGVGMVLNDGGFVSNDHFRAELFLNNDDSALENVQIFGILEILDEYYYWPAFTIDVDFDTKNIENGESSVVFLEFDFPDIDDFIPFGPMFFWGAWLIDSQSYGYDVAEFWLDYEHKWTPTPLPATSTPSPVNTPTSTVTIAPTYTATHIPGTPTRTPTSGPTGTATMTPVCTPLEVSGLIETDTVWGMTTPSLCGMYFVSSDLMVHSGATLTIEAGVEVYFGATAVLRIGGLVAGDTGRFNAAGTIGDPILFTSMSDTPAPGDWDGVFFSPQAETGFCLMEHCIVEYGGNMSFENITCNSSNPVLNECEIRHSSGAGISALNSAQPEIANCSIHDNTIYGIYIDDSFPEITGCDIYSNNFTGIFIDGASNPSVTGCTIHLHSSYGLDVLLSQGSVTLQDSNFNTNNDYPIRCWASDLGGLSGITCTGNLIQKILVEGDTVTNSAVWSEQSVPYLVDGNIMIAGNSGVTATISINAGVTMEWNRYYKMTVGSTSVINPGALTVNGTLSDPVTFTQNSDNPTAPGEWRGIEFLSQSVDEECNLTYLHIYYAGYDSTGNIVCSSASPTITSCNIVSSGYAGIVCSGGSCPAIRSCALTSNAQYGVYCTGSGTNPVIYSSLFTSNSTSIYIASGSQPLISGAFGHYNVFQANSQYAVRNTDSTTCVNATYNFWGNTNGPDDDSGAVDGCLDAGNNNDLGDNVSDDVDYRFWII